MMAENITYWVSYSVWAVRLLVRVSYVTSQDTGTLQYKNIYSFSSMRKYSVMDYFSINIGCEEN